MASVRSIIMNDIETHSSIFVAGHRGMVGSAIWRCLESKGYTNLIGRTHAELEGRMALERKQRTHRHLRHYVQKRKKKGQTMNSNPSTLLSPTPSAFSFHPSSLLSSLLSPLISAFSFPPSSLSFHPYLFKGRRGVRGITLQTFQRPTLHSSGGDKR